MEIESKPIRQADPMMTELRKRLKGYLKHPNLADLWSIIGELGPDSSFYHEEQDYSVSSESSSLSESESDETMAKRANQSRTKRDTPFSRKLQSEYQKRRFFTNLLAWAVPSPEAIAAIQQFVGSTPILEIGSGRGLWAHLLQLNQVPMIPTDQTPRQMTFTRIEAIEATAAVEKYLQPGGCLMTCWPDSGHSYATEAVKRGLDKGLLDKVIYIGEPEGGCTGDDEFHEIMEKQFTLVQQVKIPQWWGIHDDLRLYQRRSMSQ
jgi:hypothetical protein